MRRVIFSLCVNVILGSILGLINRRPRLGHRNPNIAQCQNRTWSQERHGSLNNSLNTLGLWRALSQHGIRFGNGPGRWLGWEPTERQPLSKIMYGALDEKSEHSIPYGALLPSAIALCSARLAREVGYCWIDGLMGIGITDKPGLPSKQSQTARPMFHIQGWGAQSSFRPYTIRMLSEVSGPRISWKIQIPSIALPFLSRGCGT